MNFQNLLTSVIALSMAAPAFAFPPAGRDGGGSTVIVTAHPMHRPVVIVSPAGDARERDRRERERGGYENPRPRLRPTYHAPVVIGPQVYFSGPRVYVAPRVVVRPWVYRPSIIVVRQYPMAITPIYMPIFQATSRTTIMQGELWPTHQQIDYMRYFTHYSLSMERVSDSDGDNVRKTLHVQPQIVCQDNRFGCADVMAPPPSRLVVQTLETDECNVVRMHLGAADSDSPIRSMDLTDYSRYDCEYESTYNELRADNVIHMDGYEENHLSGNRTYGTGHYGYDF